MLPFGIQPIHLILIIVVALIIFGPKRLPEIGRGLGKSLSEFRKGAKEMTDSFSEEVRRPDEPEAPARSQPMPQPPLASPVAAPAAAAPAAASAATAPAAVPVATAAPAEVTCPSCHAVNPSGAMFCNKCGTKLAY